MSYSYDTKKKPSLSRESAGEKNRSGPSADALRSGAAKPTSEQMGRRVDLPDAMRSKMENAFGADLSSVKLYESQAVGDAGAEAVTQGSNIAFAPGMLDFSSFGGQALLGHELSHVVSQARGEVTGGGFLNDHALEARADREGAMAAAGQSVAMPTAAMSSASAAPSSGPMQARKKQTAGRKPSWNERRLMKHENALSHYTNMGTSLALQQRSGVRPEDAKKLASQIAKNDKNISREQAKVDKYRKKTAGLPQSHYMFEG